MKDVLRVDNPKLASLNIKKPGVNDEKILNVMQNQHTELSSQLTELKRLVALEQTLKANPNAVVYIGDDMERLLDESEKRLESRMKLQTLLTVVLVYGVVGITAPIVYLWLSGKL
uniref:Uncharacterized protein n=1 Tax=Acrobeloides nanus TaxID=290746 RepID=A0A914EQ64_9BILA